MNETTNPIASTTHPCGSMCVTPMAFSPLPFSDFSSAYAVATNIVGIETKNEKSKAADLDMPASCPAAMVDIEREVPGNTADKIWHNPTQIACPRLISSIFQVRIGDPGAACPAFSHFDLAASMTHINRPPMSKDE